MDTNKIIEELAKAGYTITAPDHLPRPSAPPDDGPERMRPYLLATKHADGAWSGKDMKAIRAARREYNEGLVELSQVTQHGWTRMYRIPRKVPVPHRWYFTKDML